MNYVKVVAQQTLSPSTPWKRSFFPSSDQKFHATVPNFSITSSSESGRIEFWESASGDLTKEQVDAVLYGTGSQITKDTVITTSVDQTISFEGVQCDRLILTLNNSNTIARSVQVLRAVDDFRLELFRVPVNQLYTIEIPKSYESYKLAVPANFEIKFFPYHLS